MPESGEVDLEHIQHTIEHEAHGSSDSMLRWISLTTAILAAVTAVVSLQAGTTVNEALVLKSDATTLQAQASDMWAYYQAKGIKGAIAAARITSLVAAGKPAPDSLASQEKRYRHEQDSITTKARELEHERDARGVEAAKLLRQHHHFAGAVALLQVSIALGAVAALTRRRSAWYVSLAAGLIGTLLAVWAFVT